MLIGMGILPSVFRFHLLDSPVHIGPFLAPDLRKILFTLHHMGESEVALDLLHQGVFSQLFHTVRHADILQVQISLIMATAAIFVAHLEFSVPSLIKNWGTAFLTISLTGMLLPLTDWSFALGRKLGLKPETLPHVLLENGVATLFFNTAATIVLTAVNVFNNPAIEGAVAAGALPSVSAVFVSGVVRDWPIMFVISYIFAFFVTKLAIRIAMASVGNLKTAESPRNRH